MTVTTAVHARLGARLDAVSPAPLAVGLSGGGDSLALLLMAHAWAARAGRPTVAFTVDHGLQPDGEAWARWCAALCARLGLQHRTLTWTGPKPTSAIPAAARDARHQLLAEAARQAGARVLLLGHTADDLLEAALMRAQGSTVGGPAEWAPSPAWPAGRGLFLLRPMLGLRRADLRAWLSDRGETWIEDPANADPAYARARARRQLAGGGKIETLSNIPAATPAFASGPAESLVAVRRVGGRELSMAVACVAGTARPIGGRRIENILRRLAAGERFTATLAGARSAASASKLILSREPGEYHRVPARPQSLPVGVAVVWDGRYEILASRAGLVVSALHGQAARLPKAQKAALRGVPAALRATLPLISGDGLATCPILAEEPAIALRGLVFDRYRGAVGAICREAAIARVEIITPNT